jgi:hypothetical protein
MAIRIGLPPAVFPRLRLRWRTHRPRADRPSQTATGSSAKQGRWSTWSEGVARRWSLKARAAARQRALLAAFDAQYEELVDLLCWAAKDGVHTDRDRRYAALRNRMCTNHRALRATLCPFWKHADDPTCHDPFLALFVAENIDGVLHATTSIQDMMTARAALDACRDHLDARSS